MAYRMCTDHSKCKHKSMPRTRAAAKLRKAVNALTATKLNPRSRRSESIKLRVTPEQKARVQDVADELGMTVSDLVVQVVEHALPKLESQGGT